MGFNIINLNFFFLVSFFLLTGFASSSSYISNGALEPQEIIRRNLLQAKKACTENFQDKNYTILTTQCKGPQYPPKGCCDALKEFACPFTEKINDLDTDCSNVMFSYINLYGKYPPGLFANMCKGDEHGLKCAALPPSSIAPPPFLSMLLNYAFLILLSHFF